MFPVLNVHKTEVIRIFEAFAGIGAQRKALKNNGVKFQVSGMAEWYVPAIVSYQAIHNGLTLSKTKKHPPKEEMINFLEGLTLSMNSKDPVKPGYWNRKSIKHLEIIYTAVRMSQDEGNIFDVRKLKNRKLEDIDLLTYSFPCQDLSSQGIQKGMSRDSGTRSGLLWEIEKGLEKTSKDKLPKYLLMENVFALSFQKNKKDLEEWKKKLEDLGYKNDFKKINSGDFGSPQARRRVFMLSTLGSKTKLPIGEKKPKSINQILNKNPRKEDFMDKLLKYKQTNFKKTRSNINKKSLIGYTTFNSEAYLYDPKHTGPTLTASGANSRIKILVNNKIRKLNPEEAYKYMGFAKGDFVKVNNLNYLSEAKMIYTCGNSISVEVLKEIFKKLEVSYEK